VVQGYNPSYSGDRNQDDCGLKPVWATSLWNPIWKKNPSEKKRAGRKSLGVGSEFKSQCGKKEKEI
jgi:hypothetical protein